MQPVLTSPLSLIIGGWERLSMVDWPGRLTATVFLQGCTWRCRYCHNPHLLRFAHEGHIAWNDFVSWLRHRRGLLDGVVFSGGEPTWQPDLAKAMREVRELGFGVGLHTGGPSPARLVAVLPWVDWVGFDYKAPFARYSRVTQCDDGAEAAQSLSLLVESGVPLEIRTTWHPALLEVADLREMAEVLVSRGIKEWVLQKFRLEGCLDESLLQSPLGELPLEQLHLPGLAIRVR